jgi:hypothetical protein
MSEVLAWARRWARRPNAAEHELLEVAPAPTLDAVRAAYHKLARFAHPDLHRTTLGAEQLEEVTATFARVSNAYAVLSAKARRNRPAMTATSAPATEAPARTTAAPPAPAAAPPAPTAAPRPTAPRPTAAPPPQARDPKRTVTPHAEKLAPGDKPSLPIGPANAMSPKALGHYRRAELAMLRGNATEALLHLRMAVASDPQSAFLREVLAQLDER